MKIYLDSCMVIYLIEGSPQNRAAVESALQANPPTTTMISDLVRLECRVVPLRQNDQGRVERFENFFASVLVAPLTPAVYDLATELRAHHRLKTPDAIQPAAAIFHSCDEFWVNDHRLAVLESRITLRVLPQTTP